MQGAGEEAGVLQGGEVFGGEVHGFPFAIGVDAGIFGIENAAKADAGGDLGGFAAAEAEDGFELLIGFVPIFAADAGEGEAVAEFEFEPIEVPWGAVAVEHFAGCLFSLEELVAAVIFGEELFLWLGESSSFQGRFRDRLERIVAADLEEPGESGVPRLVGAFMIEAGEGVKVTEA